MRRREFITLLGGAAAIWPLAAPAQQAGPVRLVGVLMAYAESDPAAQAELAAFRGGLAKLGWTEGSNFRIELRWGAADANREGTFARELVNMRPDVILSQTTAVTAELARQTRTIPIVFVNVADPIASGFAKSRARPGGNITGFEITNVEQGGKWVELLKEIAPHTEQVALLANPDTSAPPQYFMPSIQAATSSLAIQVNYTEVHAKGEIEGVFAAQAPKPNGGLIVLPAAFNVANRDVIIAAAARYRLPTIYFNRLFPESGGLISYSANFAEQFRQAPDYIDRILKGAKPADLPIQAPTKFELIINLKTAKALGLAIPASFLSLADELLE